MGLEFNHDQGAVYVMKHLYQNGIWAIFSTLDKRVLQFKPGLLIDRDMCDEILTRLDASVALAQAEVFGGRARSTMTSARPSYARQSAA
jgi:acetylornithine/succinyldiaminopimelate/putrescine aminotransferase